MFIGVSLHERRSQLQAVVGSAGTMTGGQFVAGKRGNAFSSSGSDEVTFPMVIPPDRGAVEFWARLSGYANSDVIEWGQVPYFVIGPSVGFNGNDGASTGNAGAGLVSGFYGRAATHCYFSPVTYGEVLGNATAWHHHAFAWDQDGVPGSQFHIQLFLDGQRVGSPIICGVSADAVEFPSLSYTIKIIENQRIQPGRSTAIDELKFWDYAKTDFSDSAVGDQTTP